LGALGCFGGKAIYEVGVDRARGQDACPAGGDAEEVRYPALIYRDKSVKYGSDKDSSSLVRLHNDIIGLWVGGKWLPLFSDGIDAAYCIAQSAIVSNCLAKLLRQLPQQALAGEVAPVLRYLVAQDFREAEMLEKGYDISECFVERKAVGVIWFVEPPVHPIEKGVGSLMCYDVV